MEEAARLRGTLSAVDAQLTAARAAAEASEVVRLRSSAEASSFQAELLQVCLSPCRHAICKVQPGKPVTRSFCAALGLNAGALRDHS